MTLILGMWKLREYVCEILHAPLSSVVVMLRAIYLKDKEVHTISKKPDKIVKMTLLTCC